MLVLVHLPYFLCVPIYDDMVKSETTDTPSCTVVNDQDEVDIANGPVKEKGYTNAAIPLQAATNTDNRASAEKVV